MQRYIAPGQIGIGQEHFWVPQRLLNYRLATHFGQEVSVNEVLGNGEWQDTLDVVEIFLDVAKEIASRRYDEILGQIAQAFSVSG